MDRYLLQKMIEAQPEAKRKDLVMQLLYDEIISLKLAPGTRLNVLTGLGNGFDISLAGDRPVLIGGGAVRLKVVVDLALFFAAYKIQDKFIFKTK